MQDLEVGTDSLRAQLDKAVSGQMHVRASLKVGLYATISQEPVERHEILDEEGFAEL